MPAGGRRAEAVLAAAALVSLAGLLTLRGWRHGGAAAQVVVEVQAEGRSASDLAAGLTPALERRMRALEGAVSVLSETRDGRCRLVVEAADGADLGRLRLAAADAARGTAALGASEVRVRAASLGAPPAIELELTGGDGAERAAFAGQVLAPELGGVAGIERLETYGAATPRAVVTPLAAALAARGLSAADLVERLRALGRAMDAGRVREGEEVRPLVVRETVTSLAGLAAVRIPAGGPPVRVADVARVEVRAKGDGGWFRDDGREAVLLRIHGAPRADIVTLSRAVRQRLGALASSLPAGLRLRWLSDRGDEERRNAIALGLAVLAGALLSALAMRWPLGGWGAALAAGAAGPVVALAATAAVLPVLPLLPIPGGSTAPDLGDMAALAGAGFLLAGDLLAKRSGAAMLARAASGVPETLAFLMALVCVQAIPAGPWLDTPEAALLGAAALAAALFGLALAPLRWRGDAQARPAAPEGGAYTSLFERGSRRPLALLATGAAVVAAVAAAVVAVVAAVAASPLALASPPAATLQLGFTLPAGLGPESAAARGQALEAWVRRRVAGLGAEVLARSASGRATTGPLDTDAAEDEQPESDGAIDLLFPDAAAAEKGAARLRDAPPAAAEVQLRRGAAGVPPGAADLRVYFTGSPAEAVALRQALGAVCAEPAGGASGAGPPEFAIAWRSIALEASAGDTDALAQQVRDSLGGMDVGSVAIPGVAAAIHVDPVVPADLAALPLRLPPPGEAVAPAAAPPPATGPSVPLGALATVAPRLAPHPLWRLDGQPALALRCAAGARYVVERQLARWPAGARLVLGGEAPAAPPGLAAEQGAGDGLAGLGAGLGGLAGLAGLIGAFLVAGLPFLLAVTGSFRTACCVWGAALCPLACAAAAAATLPRADERSALAGLALAAAMAVRPGFALVAAERGLGTSFAAQGRGALLTVAGLLPLLWLGGRPGELTRPLAIVLLAAVAGSLVAGGIVGPALLALATPARQR